MIATVTVETEPKVLLRGKFSSGDPFPFAIAERRRLKGEGRKEQAAVEGVMVFDRPLLDALSTHPSPYNLPDLETRGFFPCEEMTEMTDWLCGYPKEVSSWARESSWVMNLIGRNAGNHRALEIMTQGEVAYRAVYREGKPVTSRDDFLAGKFYLDGCAANVGGIRNRTRMVTNNVRDVAEFQLKDSDQDVRILSVASGSARAVLNAMSDLSNQGFRDRVFARLIDISPRALQDSLKLAERLGLKDRVECRQCDFSRVGEYAEDFNPTISEGAGIFDYFPDDEVTTVLFLLRKYMVNNGVVIFSSVMPHYETLFATLSVGWPFMYERTEKNMRQIIDNAGFPEHKSVCHIDPFGRHCLVVAGC